MSEIRSQDRTAATRIGMPVEEYVAKRDAGLRWCSICRSFKPEKDLLQRRECSDCMKARKKEKRARLSAKRRECD